MCLVFEYLWMIRGVEKGNEGGYGKTWTKVRREESQERKKEMRI